MIDLLEKFHACQNPIRHGTEGGGSKILNFFLQSEMYIIFETYFHLPVEQILIWLCCHRSGSLIRLTIIVLLLRSHRSGSLISCSSWSDSWADDSAVPPSMASVLSLASDALDTRWWSSVGERSTGERPGVKRALVDDFIPPCSASSAGLVFISSLPPTPK